MLLALLACAPGDSAAAKAADSAAVDPSSPDALPIDGALLARTADGVYVSGGDSVDFVRLTDEPGWSAIGVDGTVAIVDADATVRVLALDDGTPLATVSPTCPADVWGDPTVPQAALELDGTVWATCASSSGGATAVAGVDPATGTAVAGSAVLSRFFVDGSGAWGAADAGREGSFVSAFDAAVGAAAADGAWGGDSVLVHDGVLVSASGELGDSDHGDVALVALDGADAPGGFALPGGQFVYGGLDALPGFVVFADVFDRAAASEAGVLYDVDGAVLDTVDACRGPRLRWTGTGVDVWCADPVRRVRWTWDGSAPVRAGEDTTELGAAELQLVPG